MQTGCGEKRISIRMTGDYDWLPMEPAHISVAAAEQLAQESCEALAPFQGLIQAKIWPGVILKRRTGTHGPLL